MIPREPFLRPIHALLAVVLLLTGCRPTDEPLRVGANVWPGYDPLFLARDLGYYPNRSVLLLEFPSTTEVIRAFRNRALDVAAVTSDEALQLAQTMPDLRIILICDVSHGADVILARPPLAAMSDLRGKRIGVESGALGSYMLSRALALHGLSANEITPVSVTVDQHETAFRNGLVDAVVTFEPMRSRLLAAGARDVFNSTQIPGEIVDILIARRDLVDAGDPRLTALLKGWFKGVAYLQAQPGEAASRMALLEQMAPEELSAAYSRILLPDRATNLEMLGEASDLNANLQRLARRMLDDRLLTTPVKTAELLDPRVIQTATP